MFLRTRLITNGVHVFVVCILVYVVATSVINTGWKTFTEAQDLEVVAEEEQLIQGVEPFDSAALEQAQRPDEKESPKDKKVEDADDENTLTAATLEKLATIMGCKDKSPKRVVRQQGNYWVLYNYVQADIEKVSCHETVTFATHGDFTFLDNIEPLIKRWMNPISVSLLAPGTDFDLTIASIRYLRDCSSQSELIKKFVSFHVYFPTDHTPVKVPNMASLLSKKPSCSEDPPYVNFNTRSSYRRLNSLKYTLNLGRNIARDAALTYYVLVSDIELYPSPGMVNKFLNFLARKPKELNSPNRRVFAVNVFEIQKGLHPPDNKMQVIEMIKKKTAVKFHKFVCKVCHEVPKTNEWLLTKETNRLEVFHTAKRLGKFKDWEPVYIGTQDEPFYDERFTWEGRMNKLVHTYIMCLLDYDFVILNNIFSVHRPGIKKSYFDRAREKTAAKTHVMIRTKVVPELQALYGKKKGCKLA